MSLISKVAAALMGTDVPLGVSLLNPLNIRRTTTVWLGQDMTDYSPYCKFKSVEYCYRAGAKILMSYQARGINTLALAIPTWAPEADGNPTEEYLKNVCAWTGIDPNTKTFLATFPILKAMDRQESGGGHFPDSAIELGLTLANPQAET